MTNNLILTLGIFTICSLINVMLNTAKTIIMYKKNILSSSLINAVTYGFYTVIVVLMAGDMPLLWKVGLTAITNFVGVWVSMLIMKRFEKDALWKVECTVFNTQIEKLDELLTDAKIPHNFLNVTGGKYSILNIYCATQKESLAVKEILKKFKVKYFVSESKTL